MDVNNLSARANAFSIAALMSDPTGAGVDPALLTGLGYCSPGMGLGGLPHPTHHGVGGQRAPTDCFYDWGQNANSYTNMPGIKGMEGKPFTLHI